jgi:uncharacterized SAM-binding protein YcdF (DUF218 family)
MLTRFFLYSVRAFTLIGIGGFFWLFGLILFTRIIPSVPLDLKTTTDGIVIFTGGKTRLEVALDLFQQNKGKYLLISGVNPDSTLPQRIEKLPLASHVTLGFEALNTAGNAQETAVWAHAHHLKTIRLITSNYHMPRSLLELQSLIPDVEIIPHPVVRDSFLNPKWWFDSETLYLVVQEYNKFLFSLIRRFFENPQIIFKGKEA